MKQYQLQLRDGNQLIFQWDISSNEIPSDIPFEITQLIDLWESVPANEDIANVKRN